MLRGRFSGAGAVAAIAGCVGYVALAAGSGLDRMSLEQPQLAGSVPAPFAAQALRSEGALLIAEGKARTALARGEAAVAQAPLDPASTALLGIARFRTGDHPGADRAFRIAGQLGWREQFTQVYWMGRALEIGDWRVAAMRLDALLRQNPELLAERQLVDPIESSSAGRAALAERILAGPNWLSNYTAALAGVPRPLLLRRAAVLGEVSARKGLLGCDAVAPLVERLIAETAEVQAAQVWRQHCPGAANSLVYDGKFAAASLQQDRSQFAWTFFGHSDANVLLEPGGASDARWLMIETTATRPRLVARQMVLLPAGTYRLSWTAEGPNGDPSDLAVAALGCSQAPAEWLPASLDRAKRRWSATVVIGTACTANWLNLGVSTKGGTVRIGDIRLDPAG